MAKEVEYICAVPIVVNDGVERKTFGKGEKVRLSEADAEYLLGTGRVVAKAAKASAPKVENRDDEGAGKRTKRG